MEGKLDPQLEKTCHPSSWGAGFLNNYDKLITYKGVRDPEVRIGIDLNEPQSKIFIY